jgi:hypothetical protein
MKGQDEADTVRVQYYEGYRTRQILSVSGIMKGTGRGRYCPCPVLCRGQDEADTVRVRYYEGERTRQILSVSCIKVPPPHFGRETEEERKSLSNSVLGKIPTNQRYRREV